MGKDLFNVSLYFIAFRETLEAAIIISVLLSLVEQIVLKIPDENGPITNNGEECREVMTRRIIKRLRICIFLGAGFGLLISLAIGAAFIVVFYVTLSDLWSKAEKVWEGIFSVIAAVMIFIMGVTMMRVDKSKYKWKFKLEKAFEGKKAEKLSKSSKTSKWVLFVLPFVTVLREGLEAVVFIGGVSLGTPATAIPIPAITGIITGAICGYIIYKSSSRINISIFLVISTCFLLLVGAGLFSKAVGYFQLYKFNLETGGDVSENGDGPGSFDPVGNVWHLSYGNPEPHGGADGWSIFNALFGWNNTATLGSVLSYVFYWIAVIVVLVYMKWNEGRTTIFGYESSTGINIRLRKEQAQLNEEISSPPTEKSPA